MSFSDLVHAQVQLLNEGKPLEAFDRYFDDDGVMFDNNSVFGQSKAECRAKQEPFMSRASRIDGNITRCSVNEEKMVCVFRNQSTRVNAAGEAMQIDGLHWQRWSSGKIVEERYYRDELMMKKIEQGILEDAEDPV
jgi:hypothetical protein